MLQKTESQCIFNSHEKEGGENMRGEYLSKIVDIDDFDEGKLNLIEAPCGSGKTYFAKHMLKEYNEEIHDDFLQTDMLYLIDSVVGKEQLLNSKEAELCYGFWSDEPYWKLPGIYVMTYAGYATLCEKAPKYNEWMSESVIVCDELQEAVLRSKWKCNDDVNLHEKALGRIAWSVEIGKNVVVAISATPDKIRDEFSWCVKDIRLHGEPRHYENAYVEEYNYVEPLLNNIQQGEKGIIYFTQIESLLYYEACLANRGIKCMSLWSTKNEKHSLSKEQLKVRNYIIEHRELPPYVDVLLINRAYATSITIGEEEKTKTPIDFMIIHTSESDVVTQVRGRYRNDLEKLYIHNPAVVDEFVIPDEWLNRPLYKEDKDNLCKYLNRKNNKNSRVFKWNTIKNQAISSGITIKDYRTNKVRYSIIEK